MITILVLSLLFLALASATGFALISLTDSTTKLFGAQSDIDQINRWHSLVANSLRPYGESQNLVAPLGIDSGLSFTTLPKNIAGAISLSTRNSYGKEIIYCPLSESFIGPAETVTDNIPYYIDSSDDSIVTYEAITKEFENGIKYVLKHRDFDFRDATLQGNTLAILISPLTKENLSCKDVQIDASGKPVIYDDEGIPAGLVRIANKDEQYSTSINKPVNINSVDYTNATTFNSLVGSYQAMQPSRFILDLHYRDGDYTVTDNLTVSSKFPGNQDQFIINGQGANSKINASSPYVITFENMSVKFNNIYFSDNVSIKLVNSTLDISDSPSTISNMVLENSQLLGSSAIIFSGDIIANNSELIFNDSLTLTGNISIADSSFNNKGSFILNGYFKANSSEVKIDGVTTITETSNSNIFLENTRFYQSSTLTLKKYPSNHLYALSLNGSSKYIVDFATLNISKSSSGNSPTLKSIYVDSTSLFSLENESELVNSIRHNFGSLIEALGKVNINNSTVKSTETVRYFITLKTGAELIIDNNSSVGSGGSANTTINDRGAKLISGTSSFIYGNQCWNNFSPIFNSVLSNSVGTSVPFINTNKVFNSSNWLCN